MVFRAGRKAKRTIYLQHGDEPSNDDMIIGLVDTARIAEFLVTAANAKIEREGGLAFDYFAPHPQA